MYWFLLYRFFSTSIRSIFITESFFPDSLVLSTLFMSKHLLPFAAPTGAPTHVEIKAFSSTSLLVKWRVRIYDFSEVRSMDIGRV